MSAGSATGGGNQQWAWLGLLKWTLAHQDGTVPSDQSAPMKQMSEEDKAFLETVMKEGIIDEGERMKFILQQFSQSMDRYRRESSALKTIDENAEEFLEEEKQENPPVDDDELEELLEELRDIVEQVDYARGFVNIKGCHYLLGAINVPVVSAAIRNQCLGILSTLAQNNPPVQKELVELGAIKTLSDMFLNSSCNKEDEEDDDTELPISTKTKIMQAISAIVRCYDLTETVFENLPQAPLLMVQGLLYSVSPSTLSLNLKTLFFLRAFLTSDNSTAERTNKFRHAVAMIADTDSRYLKPINGDVDNYRTIQIRESSISLLQQLLERKLAASLIVERKQHLASLGVQRIQTLRSKTGTDDAELTRAELSNWESFLSQLAQA